MRESKSSAGYLFQIAFKLEAYVSR